MFFQFRQLRVAVNVPSWEALRHEVTQRFRNGQGFALATINLDHLVKLRGSETFRRAYAAQDFVTADGNPIVWMSRLAGDPVDLIPGSDAILPVVRIAAQEGVTVSLVGSRDDALKAAAAYLEREVPGAKVVLQIAPPMGFDPDGAAAQDILRRIGDSGARLCLVALGAPKQELFAAAGRQTCPQVGFLSIGAGLDFFAGTQQRAPEWVRRLALEWLWRALSSPMRLGPRYVKCLAILPGHMLRALGQRLTRA
ncbi:WecB/TagA/CpsF family glycosyltransferase [Mesobacterium sp. TK19101]|uniref:WecB/TagA/CpsF family glycosyltransferase n=1 Tax=Mesobacterium hydrothermale TaxID=3111907 RepID=A0ABU6HIP9_9RHOB|nr:WecB/TagA/CpsF family glycosyltransferase [Mesobacterium sp. TK19101]MEC3861308.1 WecB/TagA/CpsF family glycosyltransferase [Mesobacterium sp. TK19101]